MVDSMGLLGDGHCLMECVSGDLHGGNGRYRVPGLGRWGMEGVVVGGMYGVGV